MVGNNRQRQSSSSSLMSIFNIFRTSSRREEYYYSSDEGTTSSVGRWTRVWPSDEDCGGWGPADINIDKKADEFIKRYKKKVTESEVHHLPPQV